ncbi:Cupin domain protein [Candidatus Bilamarchaeum dharawalense]|uniref:Cupin domain protein n=1 Tax=Candidatus Bilamarchaeum dharawalense TaxID=2885759 RepID=A0A5E4LS28_9ARCH|nr:Cupin domain protein [Candidatus Bilamarchaeum dharawalense]
MKYKTSLGECVEFIAGDSSRLREILHPAKQKIKLRYSLAHFRVAPGQKTAKHALKTSEVYFLLSGRGKMHISNEEFEVEANDTIYIPPGEVQYIENVSKEELVALCIVDPAWKKEDEIIYE